MSADDHREKAVEAALADGFLSEGIGEAYADQAARAVIAAADPHLRRMYFEEFREAVLSEEAEDAATEEGLRQWKRSDWKASDPSMMRATLEAALDKAQEIMEGERR